VKLRFGQRTHLPNSLAARLLKELETTQPRMFYATLLLYIEQHDV
jgi:hypothetical protein